MKRGAFLTIVALSVGVVCVRANAMERDYLVEYELPAIVGYHGGIGSKWKKFEAVIDTSLSSVKEVRVRVCGDAIIGRQICCPAECDTTPWLYMVTLYLQGGRDDGAFYGELRVMNSGSFDVSAQLVNVDPKTTTSLDFLAGTNDSLMVFGAPELVACCSPVSEEPQVTITRAALQVVMEPDLGLK